MTPDDLTALLSSLLALDREAEWVEFKVNDDSPEGMGEYLSALANSAALLQKEAAYLVWGVEDETRQVVGTTFRPHQKKVKGGELENWLATHLEPRLDFRFHEFTVNDLPIVVLQIPRCQYRPVTWQDTAFIRVGSYKKRLREHPEKERALWLQLSNEPFEKRIAVCDASADGVLALVDYDAYFRLNEQNLPPTKAGILERLHTERIVNRKADDLFDVTNLGAILFARKLSAFEALGRKAVRVISYTGNNRVEGGREHIEDAGYAASFESLLAYINDRLPLNEHIGQALRVEARVYPEIAIREFVANAIIHQDFGLTGDSPLVEIFTDRIEITNAGQPLISTLRFIDEPPQSRNEPLAAFMRRVKICEERGSGVDKAILAVELFQLPAPDFLVTERHTKVILFAHRPFREMSAKDRVRACYQHACLMFVSNQQLTNASLRERFSIETSNYPIVSKVISDAINDRFIKPHDPDNKSNKYARYVPFWA